MNSTALGRGDRLYNLCHVAEEIVSLMVTELTQLFVIFLC